jgi:phosphoribosylanthranilate isomerase
MNTHTFVKICGLRDPRIADHIARGTIQPDFVGFVFAPSRRQVTFDQAADLASRVSSRVRKVGVFVDADYQDLIIAAKKCQLDVLQLHGSESPELCENLRSELAAYGVSIWKSCSVGNTQEDHNGYEQILRYQNAIECVLLDTYDPNQAGGTGKTFDWTRIDKVRRVLMAANMQSKLVVAGGIHAENVESLISDHRPDGIDVSSGIEASDGSQDYEKIKTLLEKVKTR